MSPKADSPNLGCSFPPSLPPPPKPNDPAVSALQVPKGDAPSVPIAPKFLARGAGGWAPSLLGGSWGRGRGAGAPSPGGRGRSRRGSSPLPGLPPSRPLAGCAGGSDGNRARGGWGAGTTQVSPARGLPLHRVPLSHDPARHPLPLAPPPQLRCTFPKPEGALAAP